MFQSDNLLFGRATPTSSQSSKKSSSKSGLASEAESALAQPSPRRLCLVGRQLSVNMTLIVRPGYRAQAVMLVFINQGSAGYPNVTLEADFRLASVGN